MTIQKLKMKLNRYENEPISKSAAVQKKLGLSYTADIEMTSY